MANKTIKGLTVEIGGDTTKLGQALEGVNKKSKDLSSELGQINKLLKLDPGNTELLAQKQKVLADAIANSADKLKTLKEAEKQVQKQFERGEVSEEQVRELQREIIRTEKEMNGYEKAVKETTDQLKKHGKTTDDVKEKTHKFGETAKAVGKAAAAGFAAIGAAAAAAATALAKASVDAAAYADEILTTSTVTGISTDKLQEYAYAAELVDVSVETLTKSHAKNIKSMKAAQDGTKLAVDAYQKLGVEVTNADGSLRDGETVYWEVIDALGTMENETERDALAMQILGKSAQELNPLIEAGSGKMNELAQEAREVGAVLSDEALNSMGAFDDSIQRLKGSAGAAKNALGTVLLPELTLLATDGAALISEFTTNLNNAGGGLDGFISTVELMAGEIGQKLGDMLGGIITKAVELLPAIGQVGTSLVVTLAESLISNVPLLLEGATTLLMTIVSAVGQIIQPLVEALPTIITTLVNGLIEAIPVLIDGAVTLLLAVVSAIDLILPPLIEAIPLIIVTLVDGLIAAIPDLITGAVTLLQAIITAIPLFIRELLPHVPHIVDSIITGLLGALPVLVDGAVQLLMGILDAFPEIQAALIENAPSIVSSIVDGLLSAIPELIKAGGQLLEGLVKGMMDFDIGGAVKGVADSVVNGFKKIFDIHSPSRVMAGMGKMLDEGLAIGIKNNADGPVDALGRMSEDMIEGADVLNGLTMERRVVHSFSATSPAASVDGLSSKLDQILEAIKRGQVIMLDGKTLVGSTANSMNSALGQRRILAERGAV